MGIGDITLYDTSANMNCMSHTCCLKLKDPMSLRHASSMSVCLTVKHDLCLVGLMCCENAIGKLKFRHFHCIKAIMERTL